MKESEAKRFSEFLNERKVRMGASAGDVADLFLYWAAREGDVITNLKMQKLLYYAQAWHLVHFGHPLFRDDIEAWEYGPVVPAIYRKYKVHGNQPIPCDGNLEKLEKKGTTIEALFSTNQLEYLRELYSQFNAYTAHQLANMTHVEDPWKNTFRRGGSFVINPETMRKYYQKVLAESR